eukprot:10626545-Alexandrium_andersonii.AAC.1
MPVSAAHGSHALMHKRCAASELPHSQKPLPSHLLRWLGGSHQSQAHKPEHQEARPASRGVKEGSAKLHFYRHRALLFCKDGTTVHTHEIAFRRQLAHLARAWLAACKLASNPGRDPQ